MRSADLPSQSLAELDFRVDYVHYGGPHSSLGG